MYSAQVQESPNGAAPAFSFDDDSFLIHPEEWSPDLAREVAAAMGLAPLTDRHWQTIEFIRDKYLRLGALPPVASMCRRLGLHPGEVKELFGSCRQLWIVAGLPNPGEEAKAYME